ncbi:MAG: GNAT family N-acetyltransferase [Rhizobiales bacterium]|nr:GNAT family N-acetyltransferase [Hyphomicrobiales bacterium]
MAAGIFPFAPRDIEEAHRLSANIGWPHTIDDWQFAASVGQGYVARDNGQLVGTCLTWPLDHNVATLGLLIVAPHAGGRGLGRTLLRAAIEDHPTQTIVLHATDIAVPLYISEGFVQDGWVRQVQGIVSQPDVDEEPGDRGWLLRTVESQTDLSTIFTLDRQATGIDRGRILNAVLKSSDGTILCQGDQTVGFALFRPFGRGFVIGPVVAASEQGARFMLSRLLNALFGKFVRLDIVDRRIDVAWLSRFGLEEVARVQVMRKGPVTPPVSKYQKFTLIGHAFG